MDHRIQVLMTIKRFDSDNFGEEAIASVARVDFLKGLEAIGWLLKKQLIFHHKGSYHITTVGVEFLERVGLFSRRPQNPSKWKDEALTGVREKTSQASGHVVSEQSKIDRAVLSTSTMDADEGIRPDKVLAEIQNLERCRSSVCRQLGIDSDEYRSLLKEGRLRICQNGHPHIGVFDRNGPNRWKSICRRCRKEKRKKSHGRQTQEDSRNPNPC